jgi:hypothetical protein
MPCTSQPSRRRYARDSDLRPAVRRQDHPRSATRPARRPGARPRHHRRTARLTPTVAAPTRVRGAGRGAHARIPPTPHHHPSHRLRRALPTASRATGPTRTGTARHRAAAQPGRGRMHPPRPRRPQTQRHPVRHPLVVPHLPTTPRRPAVPRRECLDCRRLTSHGPRCPRCTADREDERDQARGSSAARGYDERWRQLVKLAITAQPWCSDCGVTREQAKAHDNPLTGDHLRWPAVTLDDVDVCCRRCNSIRGPVRGAASGARRRH